jgi:transcriptional regulator with XRE-family HTH domain
MSLLEGKSEIQAWNTFLFTTPKAPMKSLLMGKVRLKWAGRVNYPAYGASRGEGMTVTMLAMKVLPLPLAADVGTKIARLIEEKGWNQEDFARISGLNRLTIRQILQPNGEHRLRNATVGACARALGLSVNDLRTQPMTFLLARMSDSAPLTEPPSKARLYELATQPELVSWLERNPDRAAQLSEDDMDELLSLQGTGGPMTAFGVEHFVDLIERKKQLVNKVHAIAGTEYLDLLEQMVNLMYEKIRPYADRM